MLTPDIRYGAVLLLGPTGSGKTPLGQWIEQRGLWGQRCLHFDFGENLRRIVECGNPDELVGREKIESLRGVLQRRELLEDEHFPLAERVFQSFLQRKAATAGTLVVLNGLPRHVGQAQAMARWVEVGAVVSLDCPACVVRERLSADAGGDRTQRQDDDPAAIERKLQWFAERTAPLVEHYAQHGATILTLPVAPRTTANDLWQLLNEHLPHTAFAAHRFIW